jgi:Streptomyces sporulation and cell division protein, SsgA
MEIRKHVAVTVSTTFEVVDFGIPGPGVPVDLRYDSRNPFGIQIRITTDLGYTVDWTVARDVLDGGATGASGLGDVRVRPMPDGSDRTLIELRSPTGHALFAVATATLADFLWQTYDAVAPDTEHTWIDLDLAVSDLLGLPPRDTAA